MNEEMKVFDEINIEEGAEAIAEIAEKVGGGFRAIIAAGAVVVVGAVGGVLYKYRDRIADKATARRINKLAKKGYVILAPDSVDVEPNDGSEDEGK